jgi:hypothetical protein
LELKRRNGLVLSAVALFVFIKVIVIVAEKRIGFDFLCDNLGDIFEDSFFDTFVDSFVHNFDATFDATFDITFDAIFIAISVSISVDTSGDIDIAEGIAPRKYMCKDCEK